MAHIHPGGWTQAHACAALGTAAHFVCLAQGLEGLDICARELGIDGRCPAAVAAACGNAPVVEEYIWREMGPLDVTDAQRRTLLDIVCAQEAAADGALARSGRYTRLAWTCWRRLPGSSPVLALPSPLMPAPWHRSQDLARLLCSPALLACCARI